MIRRRGRGAVELIVEEGEDRTCYSCTISGNGVAVEETESGQADARIAGDAVRVDQGPVARARPPRR